MAAKPAAKPAGTSWGNKGADPGSSEGDAGGVPAEGVDGGDAVNPAKEKAPFFRMGGAMPVPAGEMDWGAAGTSVAVGGSTTEFTGRGGANSAGVRVTGAGSVGAASCLGDASYILDPPETGAAWGG